MTPQEFVIELYAEIVEENNAVYRELFIKTSIDEVSDTYWKSALSFFKNLSSAQQEIFFKVIRQVTVDTTSNLLGIIDGSSPLGSSGPEVALIQDSGKLSGDLQDLFLTEDERLRLA